MAGSGADGLAPTTLDSLLRVAVDKRVMFSLVGVAALVSVVGGWAISRSDGSPSASDDIVMDTAGVVPPPGIGTNAPVQGDPLPVVDLVATGGAKLSTAELLGEPLVINIWYAGCPPCQKEMPDLALVHQELGESVRFVGIDTQDPEATMLQFARDHGVGYELYRDPDGVFTSAVGIATAPVTLLVRADGTIVKQTGVLDAAKLRSLIDEYLV